MSANNFKRTSNQFERIQSLNNTNNFDLEVKKYVDLMKQTNITSIVNMNKYISKNNLWDQFSDIQRLNKFETGFSSIGVSRSAYSAISKLYKTTDSITTRLINSTKMYQETINFY